MNNKDAIINKIIDNANSEAKVILDKANQEKDEIIKNAKNLAKEYRKETFPSKDEFEKDLIERGKVLSNLEAKKIILAKKKSLIDEVFNLAILDFKNKENEKDYKSLIEAMIKENAEDGDVVQFSKDDKKIFDEKFLEALSKKLKLKLTINKNYGDFAGGLILTNKSCDKNLTLEIELNEIRAKIEADIAKAIFGEN